MTENCDYMTQAEFRAWLHWLGITPNAFARMVGISDRTARAWAAGKMLIPPGIKTELTAIAEDAACLTAEIQLRDQPPAWPQKGQAHDQYPGYERLPESAILNALSRAIVEPQLPMGEGYPC